MRGARHGWARGCTAMAAQPTEGAAMVCQGKGRGATRVRRKKSTTIGGRIGEDFSPRRGGSPARMDRGQRQRTLAHGVGRTAACESRSSGRTGVKCSGDGRQRARSNTPRRQRRRWWSRWISHQGRTARRGREPPGWAGTLVGATVVRLGRGLGCQELG
jgi:hypothetical protein